MKKCYQHAPIEDVKQKTSSGRTIVACLIVASAVVVAIVFSNRMRPVESASFQQPTTFIELVSLTPSQLETVELARRLHVEHKSATVEKEKKK